MDEIYDVLMEYVNTQAHTISFPELLVPTMLTLKKFSKNCKVSNINDMYVDLYGV